MRNRPFLFFLLITLATAGIWSTGLHSIQRQVYRKQVKRMIKHSLRQDECVRLAFHPKDLAELEWKHAKEFRYRGAMYDVIHRENGVDSVVFYCWWDAEENRLNETWEALSNIGYSRRPGHEEQQILWQHWLRGFYQHPSTAIQPFHPRELAHAPRLNATHWVSSHSEVPVPPPRDC